MQGSFEWEATYSRCYKRRIIDKTNKLNSLASYPTDGWVYSPPPGAFLNEGWFFDYQEDYADVEIVQNYHVFKVDGKWIRRKLLKYGNHHMQIVDTTNGAVGYDPKDGKHAFTLIPR